MKNKHGFTLMELLITLSLMSIISAIAYPSFSATLARLRFNGIVRQIHGDLLLARSRAVHLNQTMTFTASDTAYAIANDGTPFRSGSFPSVSITSYPSSFTFQPNGQIVSPPFSHFRVTVLDNSTLSLVTIRLSPCGIITQEVSHL